MVKCKVSHLWFVLSGRERDELLTSSFFCLEWTVNVVVLDSRWTNTNLLLMSHVVLINILCFLSIFINVKLGMWR